MLRAVMDPNTKSDGDGSRNDSTSDTLANLRELTTIVLRRAVYTVSNGYAIDGNLRDSMRRVCKMAQNREVPAEGLLVMLKDSWWDLPEAERVLGHRREEVLSRVITLCINEYFEPGDA